MTEGNALTAADLRQFGGTEQWYRHGLVRTVLFTDGAKYVADRGEAYWLPDEIAFAQRGVKQVAAEPFQFWTLKVKPDRIATLICEDGNGTCRISLVSAQRANACVEWGSIIIPETVFRR